MKLSGWAPGVFLLMAGCAVPAVHPPSPPATEWFWVPDGVEPQTIVEAARVCEAHVDGAIAHHVPVPSGYSFHVFRFVGKNTQAARKCTVDRLHATPRFTSRP